MSRSGADLALLLLGGFRCLVDAAHTELAGRGHADVRPVHDFAIRAIAAGADNASELGRRMAVSKQAAAKTIAVLQERGYIARDVDPADARRKRLQVTPPRRGQAQNAAGKPGPRQEARAPIPLPHPARASSNRPGSPARRARGTR